MSRTRVLVALAAACVIAAVALVVASLAGGSDDAPVAAGSTSSTASSSTTTTADEVTSSTVPASTTAVLATSTTRAPTTTRPSPTTAAPTTTAPAPPFVSSVRPVTGADLGASWHDGCPIGPASLRELTLSYWGFDRVVHAGRLVVHMDQTANVVAIMHALYDQRFPIQKMVPIDAYGGDDTASMNDNNTSAFNCRPVTGGSAWSEHSYGWAIDVNPVHNPYVKGSNVQPAAGRAYANRTTASPGKILAGDAVVNAFAARGWKWGGAWSSPKDYQHFSATGK